MNDWHRGLGSKEHPFLPRTGLPSRVLVSCPVEDADNFKENGQIK